MFEYAGILLGNGMIKVNVRVTVENAQQEIFKTCSQKVRQIASKVCLNDDLSQVIATILRIGLGMDSNPLEDSGSKS